MSDGKRQVMIINLTKKEIKLLKWIIHRLFLNKEYMMYHFVVNEEEIKELEKIEKKLKNEKI